MATSEPLVPKGLPKGERQKTRSNMQRAGIPLAPRTGQTSAGQPPQATSPGPASAPAGSDPVARVLAENTPADFPFLADSQAAETSTPPPSDPQSPMAALAQSSQSTFGAAVMQRLMARRGR